MRIIRIWGLRKNPVLRLGFSGYSIPRSGILGPCPELIRRFSGRRVARCRITKGNARFPHAGCGFQARPVTPVVLRDCAAKRFAFVRGNPKIVLHRGVLLWAGYRRSRSAVAVTGLFLICSIRRTMNVPNSPVRSSSTIFARILSSSSMV